MDLKSSIDKPDIAVAIFKLNLEYFPNGDLYDSLGEGYMMLGNKEQAIFNFKKPIELDGSNQHKRSIK